MAIVPRAVAPNSAPLADFKKQTRNLIQIGQEERARERRQDVHAVSAAKAQERAERQATADRKRKLVRDSWLAVVWFLAIAGGFFAVAWNWSKFAAFVHNFPT